MTNKILNQRWFVKVENEIELRNVVEKCDALGIKWNDMDDDIPKGISNYPIFVGVNSKFPYLSFSSVEFYHCENITSHFYEYVEIEKKRKNFREILDAWLDGKDIQFSIDGIEWEDKHFEYGYFQVHKDAQYRIKPKMTPLPIPDELWKFIDPEYNWFAMDNDGDICAYTTCPVIEPDARIWVESKQSNWIRVNGFITIDISNIKWDQSLTERPKGL